MVNLTINGQEYEPKLNYRFAMDIDNRLASDPSEKVRETGFNNLYNGLIAEDVDTVVEFYYSALSYLGKNKRPSIDEVADALGETGIFNTDKGLHEEIASEMQAMEHVGFLSAKIRSWSKSNNEYISALESGLKTALKELSKVNSETEGYDRAQEQLETMQDVLDGSKARLKTMNASRSSLLKLKLKSDSSKLTVVPD